MPWRELSAEALDGVIEEFVTREGTDYGHRDYPLAEKVAAVRGQLERGEARLDFDPEAGTITVVRSDPAADPSRRAASERGG